MTTLQKLKYQRERIKANIAQAELKAAECLDRYFEKAEDFKKILEGHPELKDFMVLLFKSLDDLKGHYQDKEFLDKLIHAEAVRRSRDRVKNREHQAKFRERKKERDLLTSAEPPL